jgi:hypothetical protein
MNRVGNKTAMIVLVISALAALSACGGKSNPVSSTLSQAQSAPALAQVTVVPSSMQVAAGGSFQFSVSVLPAAASNAVTWSVSGAGCSTASCGAIDASGRYLAPAAAPVPPTITIAATSTIDPTKSGTASVTIGPPASSGGTFTLTGNMTTARAEHTATLLLDGRVLITGGNTFDGYTPQALRSAELYDPSIGAFALTGSMIEPRVNHTATLLANGQVLIVGGNNDTSAELYDPSTGTFASTGGTHLPQPFSTATSLPDGQVLVAGDADAELFDPQTGTFVLAGPYASPAHGFGATATLLSDGSVLLVGDNPAQLYDPVTNTFSLTDSLNSPGYSEGGDLEHSATLLNNGKVLIAGGGTADGGGPGLADAELYAPASGTFAPASGLALGRRLHTATLLPDGKVLITGGESNDCSSNGSCGFFIGSLSSAEVYDPSTGSFATGGDMNARRDSHQATILRNGDVLITGGLYYGGINLFYGSLASAELYHPLLSTSAPTPRSAR